MKVEIVRFDNPYKLDRTKYKNAVALTRKNADFIEAVIKLDSNYRDEANDKAKSVAYSFKQLKENPNKYLEHLDASIKNVDRANSTHLESTVDGRKKMLEIIKNYCPTSKDLEKAVCVNPEKDNYNNLFYQLCATMENHQGGTANNLSFASKFISYARKHLNDNDLSFSIYDSVVSSQLSLYEHIYVDRDLKIIKSKYQNNPEQRKKLDDVGKQQYTYNKYLEYTKAIDRILYHLEKDNDIRINKEEFDHIIWYSSKGN